MTDNPYRPGAAHLPPYLAGREVERREFNRLLRQGPVLENLILTGTRGIGKTVLMKDVLRKEAVDSGWIWTSSDISEAVSVSEAHLAQRLFADLNAFTSSWEYASNELPPLGFTAAPARESICFDHHLMMALFEREPGLAADKIKRVLLDAWALMTEQMPDKKGVIFAWDEAQNLADQRKENEYPLGVLLDVFSSLQSQGVPFMLLLTGLPTLLPKLVESRTYSERMFRVQTMQNLSLADARNAIMKPLAKAPRPLKESFSRMSDAIYRSTRGYPYFLQFWCRELYDYLDQGIALPNEREMDIVDQITHKLDLDFFEGRWARLTDRQRDLLAVIARLENSGDEFTVQEVVAQSKNIGETFSASQVNQMLNALFDRGMVFKTRHGRYVLSVPLLDEYIRRRMRAQQTHPR